MVNVSRVQPGYRYQLQVLASTQAPNFQILHLQALKHCVQGQILESSQSNKAINVPHDHILVLLSLTSFAPESGGYQIR